MLNACAEFRRYDRASARKAGAVASGQSVSSARRRDRRPAIIRAGRQVGRDAPFATNRRLERAGRHRLALGRAPRVVGRVVRTVTRSRRQTHTQSYRSPDLCEARVGAGAACRSRPGEAKTRVAPSTQRTTLSGGSLGSHVDEERSQLRYAM